MDFETPAGSETLVAQGTLEGLLSGVNTLVTPQRPQLSEALAARVAPIRPHSVVETHVRPETSLLDALATLGAAARFLLCLSLLARLVSRVGALVRLEPHLLREALVAHVAAERPLAGVREQVSAELSLLTEALAAERAEIPLLSCVSAAVR